MTNQEKQAQKELASTVERETARLPRAISSKLHSDKDDYVEAAIYRLGAVIDKIRTDNNWSNAALLERLDPDYFRGNPSISRLVNHDGKRHPSAAQMFDLRRVFGISLDELADGGQPFVFEQMSDAQLVAMLEAISSEMSRRIRKK